MAAVLEYTSLKPRPVDGPITLSLPEVRQSVTGFLTPPEIYEVHATLTSAFLSKKGQEIEAGAIL